MVARFFSLLLVEREKRSMHSITGRAVISWRDWGVDKYIRVVTADRTVSSLALARQLTTADTPPASRI